MIDLYSFVNKGFQGFIWKAVFIFMHCN